MKRWTAFVLALCLLLGALPVAFAEDAAFAYLELSSGASGANVKALQQRLAQLGFFAGIVDGEYGGQTKQAVSDFQEYLQKMEQMEIDAYVKAMTPTKPPEPAPAPEPTPDADGVVPETVTPTPQPEPTPALETIPTVTTKVNGVASAELQKKLYDDALDLYLGEVEENVKSLDGMRAQRRLVYLNYLNATVDGAFGANSIYAMKSFQEAHGLKRTGFPDAETRAILYSADVKRAAKPIYNQLIEGYQGTQVELLQTQLYVLGFMTAKPGGTFGSATKKGVKAIQNYLYSYGELYASEAVPASYTPVQVTGNGELDETTGEINDGADAERVSTENGVTYVFSPTGKADPELQELLFDSGFLIYRETLSNGNTEQNSEEVKRLQRRLFALGFIDGSKSVDGNFGDITEEGVRTFQARNGLSVTGVADRETQILLFSDAALSILKPYRVTVDLSDQRVYVYAPDEYENYTVLVKEFICSTGLDSSPTPTGVYSYSTGPANRWHYFEEFECWAQYAYNIEGNILFHSVLFSKQDENSVVKGSVSKLGTKASHGCVRLAVVDCQWIYENCPRRTVVTIQE